MLSSTQQQPTQPVTANQNKPFTYLVKGQPIEREISGWQTHSYRIAAEARQFVSISIQQRGVDVGERLYAPDGKPIASFNSEIRPEGEEHTDFVAETPGDYRLDVKAEVKGSSGGYEIRITEMRPTTEHDRALHQSRTLDNRAASLAASGEFDRAIESQTRALELAEKESGPDDVYVGYLLNRLARLHSSKGNYPQAERLFQRAFAIDKQTIGFQNPETAIVLEDLGNVYTRTNQFAKADEALHQSVTIIEQTLGPAHPELAAALNLLSTYYYSRADNANAVKEALRALEIAEKTLNPDDPLIMHLLSNLGLYYIGDKNYERAEPPLQRALSIGEMRFGPESFQISLVLQNLGMVYQEYHKDYARALELYWRAETNLEKSVGSEHPLVAGILNNIANSYKSQGDLEKALELHKRVYPMMEKGYGPYSGITLVSVGNIARTYASMGDIPNAIKYQIMTDQVIEKNLELNLAIGSERQKLAYFDSMTDRTSRTISLNVQMAPNDSDARDLAATVILQRKGRVLDAIAGSLSSLRQRLNSEDQKLLDDLNSTTAQLAKLELGGRGQMPLDEFNKQVAALEEQKEKLEIEVSRRSAEFRAHSQPVTLASVKAAIPNDAALIEFAVYRQFNPKLENAQAYGETRYVAYVIRQQGDVKWVDLGSAKDIDAAVGAFRQSLGDPQRRDAKQLGRAVDEKIFQPVRALLADKAHILISPDGELNLVPFAALVDERGHYSIERYSFSYLTSGRDLLRLQVQRQSRGQAVVVADPAFGPPASITSNGTNRSDKGAHEAPQADYSQIYFGPLPGVAEEVRELKTLLPQANFLTKEQATKAALKKLNGPNILHIATHGFFLQDDQKATTASNKSQPKESERLGKLATNVENPLLRSGLALAGANQSSNGNTDGILTALEAAGLDLWGTKLVVLSACDTGVGEVKNGDGIYGLRRAFVLSGAESQVMSLWSVSDRSTRDLIVGYYQMLLQGAGRGEALRQVQLRMLKDKTHNHPYYWASFIQTGEWANLEGRR